MGLVLAVAYLTLVGWLMLRPRDVPWVAAPNLTPLATVRADLRLTFPDAARALGAGLGLLAPLGVLLPMAGARLYISGLVSFVRTVFAGLMVSLGIEFAQTGVPGQIFDVDALLLNTAGVALTYLLLVPAGRGLLRRRATRLAAHMGARGPTPTISRVGMAP